MRTAKDVLKGKGIDPSTFVFNQEGQDKLFKMLLERRGLGDFMSGVITKEEFALELSKEWAALPKDAGGRSFWAGVGDNKAHRTWEDTLAMLDKLKASGGDPLAKTTPATSSSQTTPATSSSQTTPATSSSQTTPAQLGQAITNNYGLKVGQERTFTVPGYGEVKAHKTTNGFEFFGPGFNNKLDMSKPQGKSILEYFTSTNGGQQIQPPPSTRQQTQQQVSSLSLSGPPKSSGGGITALNIGGGQQIPPAGSSPQPSGDVGVGPGRNPVPSGSFFPSSANIGIS
jgi:hypothetical protein